MSYIKNILVVEDNIANLELLICLLEKEGYELSIATDGEKALEFISKYSFDLILLDLKLPKVGGFEVLKRLKTSLNLNTPVIAITALFMDEDKRKVLTEECADYLMKPFDVSTFYETISSNLSNTSSVVETSCIQEKDFS